MTKSIVWVPIVLAGLLVGPARAQQPEGADSAATPRRTEPMSPVIQAFYDSTQAARSEMRLGRLERTAGGDPLRLGLAALRRHELTGDILDAQRAFNLFYDVASRDTTAAWAYFGIGRIVSDRPAVLFERPGLLQELLPPRRIAGVLGLEPQSRAQQALLHALLLDPTLDDAALKIADMAVVSMDPLELEIAAHALTLVTERTQAAPEVWLALSRVRGLMTDVDAANSAAMLAAAGGADRSLSMIMAARTLLTRRVTEERGARVYEEGTHVLSEPGADRYYRDVEQILDRELRWGWRTADLEERGAMLRRYWQVRAGLAGVTVARSLGEHYRLLSRAERHYGGEYGEPSPVEELLGTGDHFPNTLSMGFATALQYVYDFYQFREGDDGTSVTAALAVPVDQLRPMLTDSQIVYGIELSFIVVDTLQRRVARVDTTLYYGEVGLPDEDAYLRSYVELPVEHGRRLVYRLVVRDAFEPTTGALFGGRLELRDFRDDEIEVSDLVLTTSGGGNWTRGGLTFPLTPAQSFEADGPVTLFYEIYNLPPESPYRTRLRITPVNRGLVDRLVDVLNPGSRSMDLSFEAVTPAGDGPVQEVRTLQAGLRPDVYEIEVVVIDLRTGERATAVRRMSLVEVE